MNLTGQGRPRRVGPAALALAAASALLLVLALPAASPAAVSNSVSVRSGLVPKDRLMVVRSTITLSPRRAGRPLPKRIRVRLASTVASNRMGVVAALEPLKRISRGRARVVVRAIVVNKGRRGAATMRLRFGSASRVIWTRESHTTNVIPPGARPLKKGPLCRNIVGRFGKLTPVGAGLRIGSDRFGTRTVLAAAHQIMCGRVIASV